MEEVEAVCQTAEELMAEPPWEGLVAWLHRFLDYLATKQALSAELFDHLGRDAAVFRGCRTAFYGAGDRLLVRAQQAGAVRTDVSIDDVVLLVAGISKMPASDEGQIPRILDIALEGLRTPAPSPSRPDRPASPAVARGSRDGSVERAGTADPVDREGAPPSDATTTPGGGHDG